MEMQSEIDAIIVGAGPYGLSVAAHLHALGMTLRIFGTPMKTWREHMPSGMLLKSDGFASSLSDPKNEFTLANYCASQSLPYHDTNLPVSLATFVHYGLAFQKRYVPDLDERTVVAIDAHPSKDSRSPRFSVTLSDGQSLIGLRVIIAAGITHFPHLPENLNHLPESLASHSSAHSNLARFKHQSVTVLGGGASAVDIAVLLHEAGAKVDLIARRRAIRFHDPPSSKSRTLWQRLGTPSSGLGLGLKSRFFCEAPGVQALPLGKRLWIVEQHLGPAPGWPMRERLTGKVPLKLGVTDLQIELISGKLCLSFLASGIRQEQLTDHIIAATGYRVDTHRLPFLSAEIQQTLRTEGTSPRLSANFESSVPGLYFVGIAAAASFGPLMRFAFGAKYAANTIAAHARQWNRTRPQQQASASKERTPTVIL